MFKKHAAHVSQGEGQLSKRDAVTEPHSLVNHMLV